MRRFFVLILLALFTAAGLTAPLSSAAVTGAEAWSLRVGPGDHKNAFGFRTPYMSVRIGNEVHVEGVARATATYRLNGVAGSESGVAAIRSGVEVAGLAISGDFVEILFPGLAEPSQYTLTVDLSVPGHWERLPYNPQGDKWWPATSVHREYSFTYGVESGVAPSVIEVRPVKYTITRAAQVTRTAKVKVSAKAKRTVSVKHEGRRMSATVKTKAWATRKASVTVTVSATGVGWSQSQAASLASMRANEAAEAKADTKAKNKARTAARKAAIKKANKAAKRLAKKKALAKIKRHVARQASR